MGHDPCLPTSQGCENHVTVEVKAIWEQWSHSDVVWGEALQNQRPLKLLTGQEVTETGKEELQPVSRLPSSANQTFFFKVTFLPFFSVWEKASMAGERDKHKFRNVSANSCSWMRALLLCTSVEKLARRTALCTEPPISVSADSRPCWGFRAAEFSAQPFSSLMYPL